MSRITLRNHTEDVIRIAIYKRPAVDPSQPIIAWRIAAPPPGESQEIEIPEGFSVLAGYADDFSATNFKAEQLPFDSPSGIFYINPEDGRPSGVIVRQGMEGLMPNRVRVQNNLRAEALVTITKGGDALYEKQAIPPGSIYIEDIRPSFYMAVVSQFMLKGQHLIPDELALTQLKLPDTGRVTVTGSLWDGYLLEVS